VWNRTLASDKTSLAETLRQAIVDSGMSYYRLAKESGVAEEVIGRFVNRKRDIRLETASKLAESLELELRSR
jgi:plasmid maintenance system antidote protein VapI